MEKIKTWAIYQKLMKSIDLNSICYDKKNLKRANSEALKDKNNKIVSCAITIGRKGK